MCTESDTYSGEHDLVVQMFPKPPKTLRDRTELARGGQLEAGQKLVSKNLTLASCE